MEKTVKLLVLAPMVAGAGKFAQPGDVIDVTNLDAHRIEVAERGIRVKDLADGELSDRQKQLKAEWAEKVKSEKAEQLATRK
jgi:hypothetical protein